MESNSQLDQALVGAAQAGLAVWFLVAIPAFTAVAPAGPSAITHGVLWSPTFLIGNPALAGRPFEAGEALTGPTVTIAVPWKQKKDRVDPRYFMD